MIFNEIYFYRFIIGGEKIDDKEKSSSFDKVCQYSDILESITFEGKDAHCKQSVISQRQSMMEIIIQSPLSVIEDGICYGAGSTGKRISKESKQMFEEKQLNNVIQPLSLGLNCRRLRTIRLDNAKITDEIARSFVHDLSSVGTVHMPATFLSPTSFSIAYLWHMKEGECNFKTKCALSDENSERKLFDKFFKHHFGDESKTPLEYTDQTIDHTNFDCLHENKDPEKGAYPHIILHQQDHCLYKLVKNSVSLNEGRYLTALYAYYFLQHVNDIKKFDDDVFNNLCQILYICGNNKRKIIKEDGSTMNKFYMIRNVMMYIFKYITGNKDTNSSNDDLIYVLIQFIKKSTSQYSTTECTPKINQCCQHLKVLVDFIHCHLPYYFEYESSYWTSLRTKNENPSYQSEFRMANSTFYGPIEKRETSFKGIMPFKILLWLLSTVINNFSLTMIDGSHSTVQLIRYYLRGFISVETYKQAYITYIPMDQVKSNSENNLRYGVGLHVCLAQPSKLQLDQIKEDSNLEIKVFHHESSTIQHNSTVNNMPKENITYFIEFMNYLYNKDSDPFDFFHKYLQNKTMDDIFGKDEKLVPFNTNVTTYGQARKTNKNIYSNRLANHSRMLMYFIDNIVKFVEKCSSTEQTILLGSNSSLAQLKSGLKNFIGNKNARFMLQEGNMQYNCHSQITKHVRLFNNQFGFPRDVVYQGDISTKTDHMKQIGMDANYDALFEGANADGSFHLATKKDIAIFHEYFVLQRNSFLSALLSIMTSITSLDQATDLKKSLVKLLSYSIHGNNDLNNFDLNDMSLFINYAKYKQFLIMMSNYPKTFDKNNAARKVDELALHIERLVPFWVQTFVMDMIQNYKMTDSPFETRLKKVDSINQAAIKIFLKKVDTRMYQYQGGKQEFQSTELHDFPSQQYLKLTIGYILLHDYLQDNQQRNLQVQYEMEMVQRLTGKRSTIPWAKVPADKNLSKLYNLSHRKSIYIENCHHAIEQMSKLNVQSWNDNRLIKNHPKKEDIFNICPDLTINKCDSLHLIDTQIDPYANEPFFMMTDTINGSQDDKDSLKITMFTSSVAVKQVHFNKDEFQSEITHKMTLPEFHKVNNRQNTSKEKKAPPKLGSSLVTIKNILGQTILTKNDVNKFYNIDLFRASLENKCLSNGTLFDIHQVAKYLTLDEYVKESSMKEYVMFHPAMVMNGFRIFERNVVCLGEVRSYEASLETKRKIKQEFSCTPTIQNVHEFHTTEINQDLENQCNEVQINCFKKEWKRNMGNNHKALLKRKTLTGDKNFEQLIHDSCDKPSIDSMHTKLIICDPSNYNDPREFSTTKDSSTQICVYNIIHDNIVENRLNRKIHLNNTHRKIATAFNNKNHLMKLFKMRKDDTSNDTSNLYNIVKYMILCNENDFINAKKEADVVYLHWQKKGDLGDKVHEIYGGYKQMISHIILGPQKLYHIGTDILKFWNDQMVWTFLMIVYSLNKNGETFRVNPIEKVIDLLGYNVMTPQILNIFGLEDSFINMAVSVSKRLGTHISYENFITMAEVLDFYQYRYYCGVKNEEIISGSNEDFKTVISSTEFQSFKRLKIDLYTCCAYDFDCGNDKKKSFLEAKTIQYSMKNQLTNYYDQYYDKSNSTVGKIFSNAWYKDVYNSESTSDTTKRTSCFQRLDETYEDISHKSVTKLTTHWKKRKSEIDEAIFIKPAVSLSGLGKASPKKKRRKSTKKSGTVGLEDPCNRSIIKINGIQPLIFCEKNAPISQAAIKRICYRGLQAMQNAADRETTESGHPRLEILIDCKPDNFPTLLKENQVISLEGVIGKVTGHLKSLKDRKKTKRVSYTFLTQALRELKCKTVEDTECNYFKEIYNYVLNDEKNDVSIKNAGKHPKFKFGLNATREVNDEESNKMTYFEKLSHMGISKLLDVMVPKSFETKFKSGETESLKKKDEDHNSDCSSQGDEDNVELNEQNNDTNTYEDIQTTALKSPSSHGTFFSGETSHLVNDLTQPEVNDASKSSDISVEEITLTTSSEIKPVRVGKRKNHVVDSENSDELDLDSENESESSFPKFKHHSFKKRRTINDGSDDEEETDESDDVDNNNTV